MDPATRTRKLLLVGSCLLNSLCFSGIVFGWAPLQVMLSDEGQYADACTGGGSSACPERAEKFESIFATAAFLVNGISLPSGYFLDRFGGRAVSGNSVRQTAT